MVKVIFLFIENMNRYKEVIEFDDDVTDDIIQDEYENWVWEQVSDNFTWYRVNS